MVPELLGLVIGIISGLIPGIHPNTFASLMLASSPLLSNYFENYEIATILFIASIVYSVVNIIPAVFIGVPDEDTSLAVFPAHRLVLDGKGFDAITISAISSFASIAISIPLYYLLLISSGFVSHLTEFTKLVLLFISAYIIFLEKDYFGGSLSSWRKRLLSALIFISSGFLGFVSLRYYDTNNISILFPLLSGFFAFPTIISGMTSENIPKQEFAFKLPKISSILRGVVSGLFVSIFPGISSGVATALSISKGGDEEDYVASISSANSSNTLLNFAILISLGRIRSGIAKAFSTLTNPTSFHFLPFLALSSAFAAMSVTLLIAIPVVRFFKFVSPNIFSKIILAFLIASIYLTNGFSGIAVFAAASSIGLSTLFFGTRRISCMGAIIIPTLLS